jgi:hypothetical protein
MHATCHPLTILIYLIILIVLENSPHYEAPDCVYFSSLQSLRSPSVQIFSSAPCSQILSAYVPPLMSETKFDTHENHRQNYSFTNCNS